MASKNRAATFYCSFNVLLLLVLTFGFGKAQRSCYTPSRAYGQCVQYNQCGYLTAQLEKFGHSAVPQSFYEEVRARRCKTNAKDIYICCELQFVQTAAITSTTTPAADESNNINQRGLSILNGMKCGSPPDNRVAFGEATNLAEFPWMALLRYNSPEKYNCGGSLITNRYVLTAAHCMVRQRFNLIGVRLGEHDLDKERDCQQRGEVEQCSPPVEDFGIEKQIPHPMYKDIRNDIGLIRLDRDVDFKIHITPICLPITERSKKLQDEYFISGWGTKEDGTTSKVLLKALIPHKQISFCQQTFRSNEIGETHICAGGENRVDSCKGDSGGPLFFLAPYKTSPRYVQFGVVSFGVPACGPERSYPTLYTKVESFLPWITNNIV